VVNLSTDESAQLTCSNADLWTGTVALSWQVQFNPIDVNTIITNTDLSENHTQPFSEWPNYSDIIWRTEILNTDINHDHEWFATVFWPYVDVSISAKDTTRTATVTGAGFYWKNNVVLTFDIVGT
jgi:hypothetical protein